MFDIGFGQLLLIAIVALLVLGPERLPKAARMAGLWMRRARSQWQSVRTELERELAAEDLKRNLNEAKQALRETGQSAKTVRDQAERDLRSVGDTARRELDDARDSFAGPAKPPAPVPLPDEARAEATPLTEPPAPLPPPSLADEDIDPSRRNDG